MEERKCQAMHYVIRIQRQGDSRYLFNTRILLNDIALAKPFSTTCLLYTSDAADE